MAALEKALYFIQNNDVDEPDRIDYINYLLGYYVFNSDAGEEKIPALVNWYKTVNFNNQSKTISDYGDHTEVKKDKDGI